MSNGIRSQVQREAQGAKVLGISSARLSNIKICFPKTKREQQKIADCLSSLDELIAAESQKLEALKAHKKGLMQELFPTKGETMPKLRFPEFRDCGAWMKAQLRSLAGLINERAGTGKFIPMSVTSGVGLVPQKDKFGKEIAGSQYQNYYVIKRWDFAYNKSATKQYSEGYIAMLKDFEVASVPNSVFTCFRITSENVIPQFLNYLFQDNFHGKWLRKFIEIGARAHGALNVDTETLFNMPVIFPSIQEQQKIADHLSSLEELITAQSQKLEALKAHKKGLMQQLFPIGIGISTVYPLQVEIS